MNYKIDEGSARFPEMQQMNDTITRIYFDHDIVEKEDNEGNVITAYTAKFIDVVGKPKTAIEGAKDLVLAEIKEFDASSAINEFNLNGTSMWLDNETRDKLAKRLTVDGKSGLTTTKVIYNGMTFELPIETANDLLLQLEQYARDCFDKTNDHKAAVTALEDVAEIATYDYTVGYPTKLSFNL